MGKLQDRIEQRMLMLPEVQELFPTGGSFDPNRRKHIRIQTRRTKEDTVDDVFEVTLTLRSDEFIDEAVHIETAMKAIRKLQEGSIIKRIIPNGYEITNSELALYNQAVLNFIVITNVEKA